MFSIWINTCLHVAGFSHFTSTVQLCFEIGFLGGWSMPNLRPSRNKGISTWLSVRSDPSHKHLSWPVDSHKTNASYGEPIYIKCKAFISLFLYLTQTFHSEAPSEHSRTFSHTRRKRTHPYFSIRMCRKGFHLHSPLHLKFSLPFQQKQSPKWSCEVFTLQQENKSTKQCQNV